MVKNAQWWLLWKPNLKFCDQLSILSILLERSELMWKSSHGSDWYAPSQVDCLSSVIIGQLRRPRKLPPNDPSTQSDVGNIHIEHQMDQLHDDTVDAVIPPFQRFHHDSIFQYRGQTQLRFEQSPRGQTDHWSVEVAKYTSLTFYLAEI